MKKLVLQMTVLFSTLGLGDTPWDYGKKCAEEIGVELPAVMNCADGAEVPVTGSRDGKCDRQSFGVAGCYPGSRILQFYDTIQRNGFPERIRTTVQCRKPNNDPNSDYEFAIIQLNETNNKVCWLFPGYGKSYNAPYTARFKDNREEEDRVKAARNREWAGNSTTGCTSCHNSGTYLRTPWIMQVEGSQRGSFVRDGGTGEYRAGGRIGFPQNSMKKGFACDVGDPDKAFPKLVKINGEAFDSYLSAKGTPRAAGTASSSTCTRCHYMGSGGMTCSIAQTGLGETTPRSHLLFPGNRWMPPESDWPQNVRTEANPTAEERRQKEAGFLRYYSAAIEAVNYCCNPANIDATAKVGGKDQLICRGTTFAQSATPEDPCGNAARNPQPERRKVSDTETH